MVRDMNEEKIYDLIEKIYLKLEETTQEVKKSGMDIFSLKADVVRLENQIHDKFGVLYDAYYGSGERLGRIEDKVDSLNEKVSMHDLRLGFMENTKKLG